MATNRYTASYAAHEKDLGQLQFQKFGHPGKYSSVVTVNNTTVDFTGSNYGYGAVLVGEDGATGTIDLSGGGEINIAHLPHEVLFELSPSRIACNAKTIYVFKRSS